MTRKAEHMTSDHNASRELETTSTYKIGKITFSVDRIFRKENAETLGGIILRLIKNEVENTS